MQIHCSKPSEQSSSSQTTFEWQSPKPFLSWVHINKHSSVVRSHDLPLKVNIFLQVSQGYQKF